MHKLTRCEMGEKWVCMYMCACIYIYIYIFPSLMKSVSSKWEMAVIKLTSKALAWCKKKLILHHQPLFYLFYQLIL